MRIAALVGYDGTEFAGFQRQPTDRTVQGVLESAMAEFLGQRVIVRGAGRTDAGVHARAQVIAADVTDSVPADRWPAALNPRLPRDVRLGQSWEAEPGFDPRREATGRVYRYTLAMDHRPDPLRDRFATRVAPGLDDDAMAEAAGRLAGTHDFVSFCCVSASNGPTVRTLRRVEWHGDGALRTLEVEGGAFLYKQVRCIMGVLLAIGRGRFGVGLVDSLLAGQSRPAAIGVAPPTGLVLERVLYGQRAGAGSTL